MSSLNAPATHQGDVEPRDVAADETQDRDVREERAAVDALKRALAQAEELHDACWDETERLSNLCERSFDLKRELRTRELAAKQSPYGPPVRDERAALKELTSHIGFLEAGASATELQAAFYDLYTAELMVDKARADLLLHLAALPEDVLAAVGEPAPSQEELDNLPRAQALEHIARHMAGASAQKPGDCDPVEQLNYRRWLVELSQGAAAYAVKLADEAATHEAELSILEQQAASVEFFDAEELAEIEQNLILQRGRVVACREQLEALAPAADALDKRLEACQAELDDFLGYAQ